MAEKVTIGDAVLYLGDCEEILPGLSPVDAIIYSPPYNTLDPTIKPSGKHRTYKVWAEKNAGYFDQRDEAQYQIWQQRVLDLCLTKSPVVWINHKTRYRDGHGIHPLHFYNAPLFSEIIWDRGGGVAFNSGRFTPSFEYWFGFGRPKRWNSEVNKLLSVWRVTPGVDKAKFNDHPCPYPKRIVAPIIKACVFDGGCIDPFMGSGTTGLVAINQGKKFIGIERERKWFDLACDQIDHEQRQYRLMI